MDKAKKIRLFVIVGVVVVAAVVTYILLAKNDMFTHAGNKDGPSTTHTIKGIDPEIITIEKDPEVDKTKDIRTQIKKYVTAQHDGFNAGAFGGITNLKIKVRNTTAYTIDEVELQVSYVQANNKVFKTETVYSGSVGPNTSVALKAPDSNRGTSVRVTILSIKAKQLGLCYVAGQPGPDADDPYRCN